MPSKRVHTIRRAIFGIPLASLILGYVAMFVFDTTGAIWSAFWIGIAVTVLFVLWHLSSMVEELSQVS